MARFDIAPTKTNYMNLKQQLNFAAEGHQLLEQKRDIIVAELLGMIGTASEIQDKVDGLIKEAYLLLDRALVSLGRDKLAEMRASIPIKTMVSTSSRKVMGLNLPVVDVSVTEKKPYYSFLGTDLSLDAAVSKFHEILNDLGKLAQLRISVLRLAKEAQKTMRRVNALEKIYLPDYKDTIDYIQNALDEADRQAFFVTKLIKNRLKSKP
ncbi:MAG: V-type ATP synthase subunit D [Candidatus Auribacter fodinae]|jgi:V/A-type H+-transporting ATPase subunit D|uniref:V-type ATP synthase subunit D n=1 Tax=Candidatus Auribacter fodinae TaxID=2093366 RepID=A0A3A4R434_9BACT|nr:MAG: V-type ATP synthase subunit D [Candidatus Auribacter fodinae]